MKKLLLILCLLLTACAKEKESSPDSSAPAPSENAATTSDFAHTENFTSYVLSAKATLALSSNLSITQADAEHCAQVEADRPEVEDLCLLLFTHGHPQNHAMNVILRQRAQISFGGAVALAWHTEAAQAYTLPELVQSLTLLKDAPAGLRLGLVRAWAPDSLPAATLEALKPYLNEGDRPDTLRAYFGFWKKYDQNYFEKELGKYCDANALGKSRWRCWRVLGYLGPQSGVALHADSFGPVADDDWAIFARVYNELATRISRLIR